MAKWIHPNGDSIETNGATYIVTINGAPRITNISKWSDNAEKWITNDLAEGFYSGFKKVEEAK